MKKAIVSVYFGSRDTTSMDLLDAALSGAFPDYTVHRAFLSRHIPGAPSLETVLESLKGCKEIRLQAMLVSRGPTFQQLLQRANGLPVGAPLLDSAADCGEALARWLPKPLVLMAHGAEYLDLTEVSRSMPEDVRFAAMEGMPSLDSILPQLTGKRLHLAPFLLTSGYHTGKDLALWQRKLEEAGCTVTVHTQSLAHCPQIGEIFARHLQAAPL